MAGLLIIAFAYGDGPPNFLWLFLVGIGMLLSFSLRKMRCRYWSLYVLLGGTPCWFGLIKASLHPAVPDTGDRTPDGVACPVPLASSLLF